MVGQKQYGFGVEKPYFQSFGPPTYSDGHDVVLGKNRLFLSRKLSSALMSEMGVESHQSFRKITTFRSIVSFRFVNNVCMALLPFFCLPLFFFKAALKKKNPTSIMCHISHIS